MLPRRAPRQPRRRPIPYGSSLVYQRAILSDPRRVDDDVLDALPFPGVRDVHEAVARLDHRRVRVLAGWILEADRLMPGSPIRGEGNLQLLAPVRRRVVDEQKAAVSETQRVDSRAGIW